jgi:uncharacterized protein (DUF305 family)
MWADAHHNLDPREHSACHIVEASFHRRLTVLNKTHVAALAISLSALTPAVAQAQSNHNMSHMQGMQMSGMQNMGPAQHEMMASMDRMNKNMMQGMMDPDPGRAWMKSMAAHHQGAIDMSRIIMRHTKNQQVLREARKTADENQRSLRDLQAKMR